MGKLELCGLTSDEIFNLIGPGGFTLRHAVSVSNAVYKKRVTAVSEIPRIPKSLISFLEENFCIGLYPPHLTEVSADKTEKYLFCSPDGKYFETVYIPDNKRNTICVSTQSGCRMGCPFCVTGSYGFNGSLSAGDIVNQVLSIPESAKINRVVFMGMGEPLDNLGNVLKSCRILTEEWGLAIGSQNITVSTVGITGGVKTFLEKSDCNLTVSLLSPFPEERIKVIPAERIYPVKEILKLMTEYHVKRKRRLSAAYVMIKDFNDSDRHLEELKKMLAGTGIRVNLLPYHKTLNDSNSSSSIERMQFFRHELNIKGISASVRRSRGADISAACGLLASGLNKKNIRK
jgi:23S rRNA (adenine2503-C2)-methyltransferase